MNNKKIAFIICRNDEQEFAECQFYLQRLVLPKGFEKDIISIQEAPSMAAGYQAGMESSDAKYKVYMHQDVFIINTNFVSDLTAIFAKDSRIGMVGCVGAHSVRSDANAIASWNVGKLYSNFCVSSAQVEQTESTVDYVEVQAVDGLIMATQYDVQWRADIMDGWDFYDISQCMEFMRNGYKVVVPCQSKPWCYRDNQYNKMISYDVYRKRFIREYAEDGNFQMPEKWDDRTEFENLKQAARVEMERLIKQGKRKELCEIFINPQNRGYLHLREYETIADIEIMEYESRVTVRFWLENMGIEELIWHVRNLKHLVKRVEYQAGDMTETVERILRNYSKYAIAEIANQYVVDMESVLGAILGEERI